MVSREGAVGLNWRTHNAREQVAGGRERVRKRDQDAENHEYFLCPNNASLCGQKRSRRWMEGGCGDVERKEEGRKAPEE